MSGGEIITIHLGPYANYVASNMWNLTYLHYFKTPDENYASYFESSAQDGYNPVNPYDDATRAARFTHCQENTSLEQAVTLASTFFSFSGNKAAPRAVYCDYNGAITAPISSIRSSKQRMNNTTKYSQTSSLNSLDAYSWNSMNSSSYSMYDNYDTYDSSSRRSNQNNDSNTETETESEIDFTWQNVLFPFLFPKLKNLLYTPPTHMLPFSCESYAHGSRLASLSSVQDDGLTYIESIEDSVRVIAEQCDSPSGFRIIVDSDSAWAGLGALLIQRLADDYSLPCVVFAVSPPLPIYEAGSSGATLSTNSKSTQLSSLVTDNKKWISLTKDTLTLDEERDKFVTGQTTITESIYDIPSNTEVVYNDQLLAVILSLISLHEQSPAAQTEHIRALVSSKASLASYLHTSHANPSTISTCLLRRVAASALLTAALSEVKNVLLIPLALPWSFQIQVNTLQLLLGQADSPKGERVTRVSLENATSLPTAPATLYSVVSSPELATAIHTIFLPIYQQSMSLPQFVATISPRAKLYIASIAHFSQSPTLDGEDVATLPLLFSSEAIGIDNRESTSSNTIIMEKDKDRNTQYFHSTSFLKTGLSILSPMVRYITTQKQINRLNMIDFTQTSTVELIENLNITLEDSDIFSSDYTGAYNDNDYSDRSQSQADKQKANLSSKRLTFMKPTTIISVFSGFNEIAYRLLSKTTKIFSYDKNFISKLDSLGASSSGNPTISSNPQSNFSSVVKNSSTASRVRVITEKLMQQYQTFMSNVNGGRAIYPRYSFAISLGDGILLPSQFPMIHTIAPIYWPYESLASTIADSYRQMYIKSLSSAANMKSQTNTNKDRQSNLNFVSNATSEYGFSQGYSFSANRDREGADSNASQNKSTKTRVSQVNTMMNPYYAHHSRNTQPIYAVCQVFTSAQFYPYIKMLQKLLLEASQNSTIMNEFRDNNYEDDDIMEQSQTLSIVADDYLE